MTDTRRTELVEIVARAIWIAAAKMDSGAKRFMHEWEKVDNRTRATWLYYATDALDALTAAGVDLEGWREPPDNCDGKEQEAFEAWARAQRYDMHEHPLHYLFMDKVTNAARMGWNAAIRYARDVAKPHIPTPPKDKTNV